MRVFVQGMWHCGCVISACLSELNHQVIGYDENKLIIRRIKKNIPPLYEPGLKELIKKNVKKKNLSFTSSLKNINSTNVIWFAFDTPTNNEDQADTNYVLNQIKFL